MPRALVWPPLLLWRRGTGRGGRDFCNPQEWLNEWPKQVGRWPQRRYAVEGLLPPTLSSKGGEGEARFVRCVNQDQLQWGSGEGFVSLAAIVLDCPSRYRPCLQAAGFGMFSSVVMACINPHRLGLPGAIESTLAVKVYRTAVGDEHVLVKAIVTCHEH